MDVIFDWNLGNMIYNGLITLRLCGFPFMENQVASVGIRAILDPRTKPSEMDDRIGRERSFGYIPTLHLLLCKAYLFIDLLTPGSLKHVDGNECRMAASRTATSGPRQAYLQPT